MTVRWSKLERPTKEGFVNVAGRGMVMVYEKDIRLAQESGLADPVFNLIDVNGGYKLGKMHPDAV